MNEWRVTQPGSNQYMRISDLIGRLRAIQQEHGDLLCYLYSADLRKDVPLLDLCLKPGRTLVMSTQTDSVCNEMYVDLIEENERLRRGAEG